MEVVTNPLRGRGLPDVSDLPLQRLRSDPSAALALLARCPAHAPTPLRTLLPLAERLGVGQLYCKDERSRMGLGSFKALGAGHVIARMAADRLDRPHEPASADDLATALHGTVFVCASAGNHGMSVAAAAAVFGAEARVYLSETVPEAFAQRLRARGATVVRAGSDYEASMTAAEQDAEAAEDRGWVLLSDSSWPGYLEIPAQVMEGYLVLAAEMVDAIDPAATHVVVQAGVGGLAAAVAALVRDRWGDGPRVVVVEPSRAPALQASIRAGRMVTAPGPVSSMGRLDCKEPSLLALAELARTADHFVTLDDAEVEESVVLLRTYGMDTTPSGAAGVAALHHAGIHREALGLDGDSRVAAIITEAPEDVLVVADGAELLTRRAPTELPII